MKLFRTVILVLIFGGLAVFYWGRDRSVTEKDAESVPPESILPDNALRKEKPAVPMDTDALPAAVDRTLDTEARKDVGSIGGELVFQELEEVDVFVNQKSHSHKNREWLGQLSPSLNEIAATWEDGVVRLRLPGILEDSVELIRHDAIGSGQGVFTGRIDGLAGSSVVLSYVNQAVAGSIKDAENELVLEIRNAGGGQQFIAEVNVEALGECALCKGVH